MEAVIEARATAACAWVVYLGTACPTRRASSMASSAAVSFSRDFTNKSCDWALMALAKSGLLA